LLLSINSMMIAAALFVGCHYCIDLVAGTIVAAASVALVNAAYPRLVDVATAILARGTRMRARRRILADA
jgi:membrane-associated phospholipid phosphatase